MRRKVVVQLTLTLKEEVAEELSSAEPLLFDIVDGVELWGGQRHADDPLFYPYSHVRAQLSNGVYWESEEPE